MAFLQDARVTLILLLLTMVPSAFAQNISPIVQPIGRVVQVWDGSSVNQYLAKWDPNIVPGVTDPFDTRFPVTEVQPSQPMYFVRVFTEPNSGPLGSFIVRASVIRGLTRQQIRDVLALPELPTKIDYVKVPGNAKYGLWTGIAGPIFSPGHEWGHGGGLQTKIIGQETNSNPPADLSRWADYSRLPANSYMNAQLIGEKALSYSEVVKIGNAGKVAAYLDRHLPQPYSDLEMVYSTLDFINADGPAELAVALASISPIYFDTYSTTLFRNDLLFERSLLEHPLGDPGPYTRNCYSSWINLSGEQGQQSQNSEQVGFYYQTGALVGGTDFHIAPSFKVGIGLGYLHDHLGWNLNAGNADINNVKAGIYLTYIESNYFFNSLLTAGYNWGLAQRNINFTGAGIAVLSQQVVDSLSVNRTATSNQNGGNVGLYFNGGKNFHFKGWLLMPTAQVSYFYSKQGEFNERGAGDLNLQVQNYEAQTIRIQLAALVGKQFCTPQKNIIRANVQLGWAHNFPFDSRTITASLPSLGGAFNVNGNNQETNELIASANIGTRVKKRFWVDAQYNAFFRQGFSSQAGSLILKYYLDA